MKTIQIGLQVWTTKNLRVFKFCNGDFIPIVQDNEEWSKLESPAMCINPYNGECYYNWFAVSDPRSLAPAGFYVPSDGEWQQLVDYCGGDEKAGKFMKSTKKWDGTGPVKGFNAIPSGYRNSDDGNFNGQGYHGYWWSSSPNGTAAWFRALHSGDSSVYRYGGNTRYGFSVRLIKIRKIDPDKNDE
jgi:uncharacterized protein (TIGR02145 family)